MSHTINRTGSLTLLFTIALLSGFRFVDNDDFINQLLARFKAYNQERPIEKVYIHTDRDAYLTAETIWLKGYVISGNNHTSDTISRVVYVDLIDPLARRIRLRAQLRATSSYAPGQLTLPDSLPAGTYQLRGYTNYMRNFPEDYFYSKTLTILRPDETGATPVATRSGSRASGIGQISPPDVQFLPEGGQLIEGLEGRVAFKAVSQLGRSVAVKGFVLDARNDTITGFASTHLGMGYFMLKPQPGQTYKAFVELPDGQVASYPIPAAQAQGVVMLVDNTTSKDKVKVYLSHTKTSADPSATMTFMAQTRGLVVQMAKVPLAKKVALIQLLKAEFPEGIAQLTLFDETNKPVCERLIFINQDNRISITLAPAKTVYKNREKVELTVTTTDAAGKPVAANVSLAALDSRLAPEADSNAATLVSHLLLSSDLTGGIEQPGYYFDPRHDERWQHLDLLLMTQGWRRFAWSDVLAGTVPPTNYPAEQGLSLTGRVMRPNQKDIGGKVRVTFVIARRDSAETRGQRDFLAGETDEAGRFGAYNLDFTDTTIVLIQGVKGKANRDVAISLDQLLTPKVTILKVPYNPLEFRRDELEEFLKRTREYQEIERQIRRNGEVLLQAVTVKAKKYKERDSRTLYGSADATIKFDPNLTAGSQTVLDVIQGRIAGVQVFGSGQTARVQIRGAANFSGAVEPLFLLDGTPIDLSGILSVSVQDVERVDVLKGPSAAIYGSRGSGGVISVLTKRGSPDYDLTKEEAPGTLVAKLPGYLPIREFYAPRYDADPEQLKKLGLDRRPDYRTTLFWAPLIQTNAEGKATVSFFTSDAKTTIQLRAEGITPGGMPGMGQRFVKVD